jgi:3'-phosphoadenosine 5'-phosphosulfate sulfotransferase (PAPS reductase)/FAD synthetase
VSNAERIGTRIVVASISGGKDSAAMSLYLTELGIPHRRVFMDTGWENQKTYDYLRGELTRVIGSIEEIRGDLLMKDLIRKKGMFPSKQRRYCTQELKVFPMQRYINALVDQGHEIVNTVGIRRAESEARSRMTEWEFSDGFDCEVWRPILHWSEDDVIAIHQRHGLRPNPLYLEGASRVGCWPCIYARKSEIKHIADVDPKRIAEIRDLEDEVDVMQRARAARDGRVLQHKASWFQSPLKEEGGNCWPIDRVVAWSRTLRGGRIEDRQVELFAQADEGCMRWGLCDTGSDEDASGGGS